MGWNKLELGCGERRVSSNSIGVDIKRNSKCDLIADAHYLPFIEKSFTETVILQVLEHLHSPYIALKEISRVSQNILLSIPNRFYYRNILRWSFKGKLSVGDHIYCWTLPEITNLLWECGFKVCHVSFMGGHFHKKDKLEKVLPRITCHSMVIRACKV